MKEYKFEELNIETQEKVKQQYSELEEFVMSKDKNMPLEDLCFNLKGHNLHENLFDCYYGEILATVNKNELGFYLSQTIKLWYNDEWISIDTGSWSEREW